MTGAVYTDFSQLAQLRVSAQQDQSAALEETAAQFEALFIQMMLKPMREAVVEGGLFDTSQLETYQTMVDQQVSLQLAEQGGIGIARAMIEQMQTRGMVPAGPTETVRSVTESITDTVGIPIRASLDAKAYPEGVAIPLRVDERA